MRILIVEDEPGMAMGLEDNLRSQGYETLIARDGEAGLEMALRERPDLIVLDIMLPRKDGFEVCRELRSRNVSVPILMLTARGQEADKVRGLDLGADDYITKPFSVKEFLARVRASLRRWEERKQIETVRFGGVCIDFVRHLATKRGVEIELSHREFELLRFLVEHEGEVLSRDRILDEVWGPDALPTPRTVDVRVANLRAKLEDRPDHPEHILTVHRVGYRFEGSADPEEKR